MCTRYSLHISTQTHKFHTRQIEAEERARPIVSVYARRRHASDKLTRCTHSILYKTNVHMPWTSETQEDEDEDRRSMGARSLVSDSDGAIWCSIVSHCFFQLISWRRIWVSFDYSKAEIIGAKVCTFSVNWMSRWYASIKCVEIVPLVSGQLDLLIIFLNSTFN